MTNEELLSVAEIVERATNRFNAQAAYHRERFDEHVKLIASMKADHEAKMVEHRAAFGARTEADAKIIAGLRSEIGAARMAVLERDSLISERDGLLTQVQDIGKACRMRVDEYPLSAVIRLVRDDAERAEVAKRLVAERDALRAEVAALQERLRASIARGDFAQMEVAALKPQIPKHPVKVGEWVKASNGAVAQVLEVHKDWYLISRGHGWTFANCEPCDPPEAMHDTEAGKAAAEAAVKTDPVAEEIKVGDVVKVVGASGCLTAQSDIGKIGEVLKIDSQDGTVRLSGAAGWVDQCDVRKVTT